MVPFVVAVSLLAVAQPPTRACDWHWQGWAGSRPGTEQTLFLRSRGLIALPGMSSDGGVTAGVSAFVAAWLAAHPNAQVQTVHRFEGLPWSWVLVRDGEANLNVELVRAGWTSAPNMVDESGRLQSLGATQRTELLAAIDAAEVEALQRRAGIWGRAGDEGARQWRLGERAFERGEFAAALAHYDATRAAGQETPWLDAQRASCLRALGREEEASLADERALAEEASGFGYAMKLEGALRARAAK